jgi:hypothetical protein
VHLRDEAQARRVDLEKIGIPVPVDVAAFRHDAAADITVADGYRQRGRREQHQASAVSETAKSSSIVISRRKGKICAS